MLMTSLWMMRLSSTAYKRSHEFTGVSRCLWVPVYEAPVCQARVAHGCPPCYERALLARNTFWNINISCLRRESATCTSTQTLKVCRMRGRERDRYRVDECVGRQYLKKPTSSTRLQNYGVHTFAAHLPSTVATNVGQGYINYLNLTSISEFDLNYWTFI